jgi:hypothetical protein
MAKEQTLTLTLKVQDDGTVVIDKFNKTIKQTADNVASMSKTMQVVGVAAFINIAQQAINATIRVAQFAASMAETGDAIQRNARALGMTTAEYQKWQHVAERSDVDAQSFATGLKILSRHMLDAQSGMKEAVDTFQALGIEFKDGQGRLKSYEEMLGILAETL